MARWAIAGALGKPKKFEFSCPRAGQVFWQAGQVVLAWQIAEYLMQY
ncbi:MAG: hypothetical protein JOZ36_15405 [Acidobacteria bacterium]|nr:hypothetical protein [Acidobacteriota bacterium]